MKKKVKRKEKQSLIVLKHANKIYYPRLTIRSSLVIDKLFGDITRPLITIPSVETQILILSLALEYYDLSNDELYDVADSVEDLNFLVLELYQEAGIINQNQSKLPAKREREAINDIQDDSVTFESHVMDLLGQCMSIGMREEEFYKSTLAQVTRYVEAYNKQQQSELQEKAYFDYQLANLIGISVSRLLSKDAKYPEFKKAYPFIGRGTQEKVDEQWEMEVQRIKLREWAEQMNKKFNVVGGE